MKEIFVDFMEKTSLMYDFREKIMEFHSKGMFKKSPHEFFPM